MYIGNDLQIAHPSYKIIDDISSGFNGSTTSFALQVSGATPVPFPISTQQVMISVNGVVQEPDPTGSAGFKLLGSNIVFSSAPANGHAFFGVINAGADYVTAGSEFPDGSATAPSFTFQDDQDTGWFRNASGDVGYSSNGTAILNFDGNGLTVTTGNVTIPDKIIHNGDTNTAIRFPAADTVAVETAGSERLRINSAGNIGIGGNAPNYQVHATTGIGIGAHGFAQQLSLGNNTIQSLILGTGYTTLNLNQLGGNVDIANDTSKLRFGTSQDLQIFHDGSNSFIYQDGTGELKVNTATFRVMDRNGGETQILASQNGAVELFHNNVKVFNTDGNGIMVKGPEGGAANVYIYADEGDDDADKWSLTSNTDGTLTINNRASGSFETNLKLTGNAGVHLYYDNTAVCYTATDALRFNDSKYLKFGNSQDLKIVHDGSDSYIDHGSVGHLFIRTASTDKAIRCVTDGAVELHFDDAKKLETTSSGINVTGAINVNGTALSAAPEISGTASGSIAQDKAVYVKTDGTLAQVVASYANTSPQTSSNATGMQFGSNDDFETHTAMGYNPVDNHLFFAGDQKNNSRGYLQPVVLTGAGEIPTSNACSFTQFHNGRVESLNFVWDSDNSKLALLYQKQSNNYSCIRTVSAGGGCAATLGTELQYTTQSAQLNAMARACFNETTGTIFQIGATSSGGLALFELEWTGANYTFRNRYVILSSGTITYPEIVYDPDTQKLVVIYTSGSDLKAKSITPTGTSTSRSYTAGSPITLDNNLDYARAVYDTSVNKVVVLATNNQTQRAKWVMLISVASNGTLTKEGTTTSTSITSSSGRVGSHELVFDPQTENTIVFAVDSSQSGYFGCKRISVSGTSITIGSWNRLRNSNMNGQNDDTSGVYMTNGKMASVTTGGWGGCWGLNFTSSTTATPLTTSNFVGFAKAAATNGNSVDVKVVGNTTTQSGLTAGSKYYVQGGGTLGTTADTPSVEAGTALSSTKLLIKG